MKNSDSTIIEAKAQYASDLMNDRDGLARMWYFMTEYKEQHVPSFDEMCESIRVAREYNNLPTDDFFIKPAAREYIKRVEYANNVKPRQVNKVAVNSKTVAETRKKIEARPDFIRWMSIPT